MHFFLFFFCCLSVQVVIIIVLYSFVAPAFLPGAEVHRGHLGHIQTIKGSIKP